MNASRLHLSEQVKRRHRRWRVEDFAHDIRRGKRRGEIDIREIKIVGFCVVSRGRYGPLTRGAHCHECNQVADMDHSRRIVERVVVHNQARMRGDLENFDRLAERNVLLDGDDVGARHHDSFDSGLPEPEDVLEHRGFFGRKVGLRLFRSQDELKVRARRSRTPTEQHALEAREQALTLFSLRGHHYRKCVALGRFGAWSRVSHLWSWASRSPSPFYALRAVRARLLAPRFAAGLACWRLAGTREWYGSGIANCRKTARSACSISRASPSLS